MAITGPKPSACFKRFKKHLTALFAKTLGPEVRPILVGGSRKELAFLEVRFGGGPTIRLETNLGPLRLLIKQELLALKEKRQPYRLKTIRYWYHLYPSDSDLGDPLLRWEYESPRLLPEAKHCLNHVHLHHDVPCGTGKLDLVRCHLPTGWVTIESIIRFVLHELEVSSASENWDALLNDSERQFKSDFTID